MPRCCRLLLPLALLALAPGAAHAQPPPDVRSELLRAARLLERSRAFPRAQEQTATLGARRLALAEKTVQDVLAILRKTLARPDLVPPPAAAPEAGLEQSAGLRSLGRLLRVQQYVFLADGRVHDAVLAARLSLRLGRALQADTAIGALVGIAVGGAGVAELSRHLDQLALRECDLLSQVCLEWLNQPHPMLRVLEGERRYGRRRLAELREQLLKEIDPAAPAEEARKAREAAGAAIALQEKELDAVYALLVEELRQPPWLWKPLELAPGSPGAALAGSLLPALNSLANAYVAEMARVRMMACHAAILRFRWEQSRLPRGLEELRLGDLAVDPFTGQALKYEALNAARYRLSSAGPRAPVGDPRAVDGRLPLALPPEP